MQDLLDELYETFMHLSAQVPPAEAIKRLERFGATPEIIAAIHARHARELAKIKELDEPRTVVNGNRETWYTGPRAGDKYWPGVKQILERSGWSSRAVESLDDSSSRIVSLLEHPQQPFETRGLVVGHVQSGKTTNFTSVIAKAADRGYRLIIVLSGIHNGLRRQTQLRLVSELVRPNESDWLQLTGPDHDFVPTENPAAYFGKSNKTRIICVVKKNAPVLTKLAAWLEKASKYLKDCPTLIIDDEADQATVATKRINPLILRIMGTLPRCAYLGYTATPFANLLIDPSAVDLYPRDFVVNLPKPENHFGTEVLFGRDALDDEDPGAASDGYDMIRIIPSEDLALVRPRKRTEVDGFAPMIQGALTDAVEYFLLATAARRERGTGNPHNTMLIHTSVNTAVHNSFRGPLDGLLRHMRAMLNSDDYVDRLRNMWDTESSRVPAEEFGETKVAFDAVIRHLPSVIADCRVVMDNSSSPDRLDYQNGPVVAIAVGGNTLSRGLTLEGLSVSYFVRAVSAYDTLLQMGRWFGFREGYADLPRIWMTGELARWFRHLATVEHEMRRDIEVYMTEDETPLSFAVRLRKHPALRVTAAAKMQNAVTAASSYGGKRVQTHYFNTNSAWLLRNTEAARDLVANALAHGVRTQRWNDESRVVFHGVPHDLVLGFLGAYQFHPESQEANSELISGYIEKRVKSADALRRWNIAVIGSPLAHENAFEFVPGISVGRITRAQLAKSGTDYADIKTLMSRRDAGIDLESASNSLTEKQIIDTRSKQLPDVGLLALYAIDKTSSPPPAHTSSRLPLDADEHVIGVGIVFPNPAGEDSEVEGYVSADLSKVDYIEEEDLTALDKEDE